MRPDFIIWQTFAATRQMGAFSFKHYIGSNKTTLKDRKKEIGDGLLHSMLKDLGLTRNDIK